MKVSRPHTLFIPKGIWTMLSKKVDKHSSNTIDETCTLAKHYGDIT